MSGFDFNPFEVGNPMTLGMIEDSLINDIRKLQRAAQYHTVTANHIQNVLDSYNVSWHDLPRFIQEEIDRIDIK